MKLFMNSASVQRTAEFILRVELRIHVEQRRAESVLLRVWYKIIATTCIRNSIGARVATCTAREYWMIYRGPGFLAIVWFGSPPTPSPSVSSTGDAPEDWERETTCWREKVGGSQIIRWLESLVLWKSFNILSVFLWMNIFERSMPNWPPLQKINKDDGKLYLRWIPFSSHLDKSFVHITVNCEWKVYLVVPKP